MVNYRVTMSLFAEGKQPTWERVGVMLATGVRYCIPVLDLAFASTDITDNNLSQIICKEMIVLV